MLIGRREKISEEQNRKLETFAIIGLIAFALIYYAFVHFVLKKDNRTVSIFYNGEKITQVGGHRIDLDINGTYTIGDKNGEYNIIEINNHRIRCVDANCPDKVCVSHDYLNPDIDNDMIICAPHKLIIQYD